MPRETSAAIGELFRGFSGYVQADAKSVYDFTFLGIVLGLAIGKPLGIFGASAGAVRAGLATRPTDVSHGGVALVGVVGGIGFTMSIFVAQLAFPPGPLLDTAKLAILPLGSGAASAFGMLAGLALLRRRR